MHAGVRVIINLAQKPPVTAQRNRIDHHVDEGKEQHGQREHRPRGTEGRIKL